MPALALIGTDTAVGKTHVTTALVRSLRAFGRQVWLHKPVACGGWDGESSEDGRALRALCGDGQDPATVCPQEFPEPCSPHLAAEAADSPVPIADMIDAAAGLQPPDGALLLLETAGGLLSPIAAGRATNADLLATLGWPAVVVTRPHLGTLNHTQLTVNEARRRGIRLLGLVLNHHEVVAEGIATRTAAGELVALTGLPVLANLPYAPDSVSAAEGLGLARAVVAAMH